MNQTSVYIPKLMKKEMVSLLWKIKIMLLQVGGSSHLVVWSHWLQGSRL